MPFYFFIWTPDTIEHVAEHGVTPEEFEEVVSWPEAETTSRSTGNPLAFRVTSSGRLLCCVFRRLNDTLIEPVTAFEIEE